MGVEIFDQGVLWPRFSQNSRQILAFFAHRQIPRPNQCSRNISSLSLPNGLITPPTSVPNLGLFGQGVGEGEFFENSQTCELELEVQNGAPSLEKLVNDFFRPSTGGPLP